MNPFEVRPARDIATPNYPCFAHGGGASQGEPAAMAGSRPPMISNRGLGFAPLVLFAAVPAFSMAAPKKAEVVACEPRQEAAARPAIARLTEKEIEGLVGDLNAMQQPPMMMEGLRKAVTGALTEQEARSLLAAFLKKNGIEAAPLMRDGAQAGLYDPAKRVGVAWPGPAADDLALMRARGEARILVVDGIAERYDVEGVYGGRLPTKRGVVHALLAEVERFLQANE